MPTTASFRGSYPLHELSPRRFEELVHQLLIRTGGLGTGLLIPRFSSVELMPGVGDQGRDVLLEFEGKTVGIVQCKHSVRFGNRISRPAVLSEICKYLLYCHLKEEPEEGGQITYVFATNVDLTGPAAQLLSDVPWAIREQPSAFRKMVGRVKKSFKAFQEVRVDDGLCDSLLRRAEYCTFTKVVGSHINSQIASHEGQIVPSFFEVRSVVDDQLSARIAAWLDSEESESDFTQTSLRDALGGYLARAVAQYSYLKTLVFRNQQVLLKDLYQPLTLVSARSGALTTVDGYPLGLIKEHRKILVRSTAGMGKSTVLRRMFIGTFELDSGSLAGTPRYPIFVELRRLSRSHDIVAEILNSFDSLRRPSRDEFVKMVDEGVFVFFLDGYDEIKLPDREAVTRNLTTFLSRADRNFCILSSRPDSALVSFPNFQEFSIKPLKIKESYDLIYKYGGGIAQAAGLVTKLREPEFKQVRTFLRNPMLVSLLFVAYRHKPKLPFKKHLFYAQVYQALFEEHDLTKDSLEREKYSGLDLGEFEKILQHMAFNGARQGMVEYSNSELLDLIDRASKFCQIPCASSAVIRDLLSSVPLFLQDGPYLSWSHKSLQDYFAARFLDTAPGPLRQKLMRRIYQTSHTVRFGHILTVYQEMNPRGFRSTILRWFLEDFEEHNSSDRYDSLRPVVGDEAVNLRLLLTFGREVAFRIYGAERSLHLRKLKHNDRLKDIASDWNLDGSSLPLDSWTELAHNRQRERVLAVVTNWEGRIKNVFGILAQIEPSAVHSRKELGLSTRRVWPTGKPISVAPPEGPGSVDVSAFRDVNWMLQRGPYLNGDWAKKELELIRADDLEDDASELLNF